MTPTSPHPVSLAENLEHLRYLHSVAEHYKDTIYARAGVLLALVGGQVAALAVVPNMIGDAHAALASAYARVLLTATFAVHLVAAFYALLAIMPLPDLAAVQSILRKKSHEHRRAGITLFSSFNHVVELPRDDFMRSLSEADAKRLFEDLSYTYYNLCHITNDRYLRLRKAFVWQLISMSLLIIIIAIALFSGSTSSVPPVTPV